MELIRIYANKIFNMAATSHWIAIRFTEPKILVIENQSGWKIIWC